MANTNSEYIYCSICDIKMNEEDMESHLAGKRHKANKAKKVAREEAATRTVFVQNIRDMDMELEDKKKALTEYFSTFGELSALRVTEHCAFVEYKDASTPEKVLSVRPHMVQGLRLPVRKYVYREPAESQKCLREAQERAEKEKSEEEIMLSLMAANDIEDQIQILSMKCRLSNHDRKRREGVCKELTRVFSPYFDFCQVHQFGSSINGFGITGCDLDIYIELSNSDESTPANNDKPCVNLVPFTKGLRTLQFFSQGPLGAAELYNADPLDLVKLLSRVLISKRGEYLDVQHIPSNRCPVVRFCHKRTMYKCDLSLNNGVALLNSKLLRLYSQVPRVHEVVTAVRMWAKQQNLANSQQLSHQLTSYSITWLVLFYLQTLDPPLVPKVADLYDLITGACVKKMQGYDCLAIPPGTNLTKSPNTSSSVDLLRGFFDFYNNQVILESDALVTREGEIYPRHALKAISTYEKCNLGQITIIDPFILSHNLTQNINEKVKFRLIAHLKMALELIEQWSDSGSKEASWGLADLLLPRPDPPELIASFRANNKKKNRAGAKIADQFCFELNSVTAAAQQNNSVKKKNVDKLWFDQFRDMVVKVLTCVFFVHIREEVGGTQTELSPDCEQACTASSSSGQASRESGGNSDNDESENSNDEHAEGEEYSTTNKQRTFTPQKERWVITESSSSDSGSSDEEFHDASDSLDFAITDDCSPAVVKEITQTDSLTNNDFVASTSQKRRFDSSCEPNLNHRRLRGEEPTAGCASHPRGENTNTKIVSGPRGAEPTTKSVSDPPDNFCGQHMEVEHCEDHSKNNETPAKVKCLPSDNSCNNKDRTLISRTDQNSCGNPSNTQIAHDSKQPEGASSEITDEVKEGELSLSCVVYMVMWRDRGRVRKVLKNSKNLQGLELEQAVSTNYLSEHVKFGFVPAELDVLLRSETEVTEGMSWRDFVPSSVPDSLLESVKFPKVKFLCTACVSPDDVSKVEVTMKPDTSSTDDLQFFKLFFDSFQAVMSSLVKPQGIRATQ